MRISMSMSFLENVQLKKMYIDFTCDPAGASLLTAQSVQHPHSICLCGNPQRLIFQQFQETTYDGRAGV